MALFEITKAGASSLNLTGLELVPNSISTPTITVNIGDYLILTIRNLTDTINGADLLGSLDGSVYLLDQTRVCYMGLYKATSTTVTTSNANGFAGVNKITTT